MNEVTSRLDRFGCRYIHGNGRYVYMCMGKYNKILRVFIRYYHSGLSDECSVVGIYMVARGYQSINQGSLYLTRLYKSPCHGMLGTSHARCITSL